MEQQIRFCTTPDGTQLAYAMYDEGGKTPFVIVAGWGASQELLWELPEGRAFYERLAQGRKLVTFDRRGVGASQREVDDLSVDAQVSDLLALVDHVKLGRFDVLSFHGALTVPLAAQNPERVRRLILWAPTARAEKEGTGTTPLQGTRTLLELIRWNWQLARRSLASFQYPNGPVEKQRWWSTVLRESISSETLARYLESFTTKEIGPFLSRVRSPTLILHRRGDRLNPMSGGRAIAAGIPDARFVALEGDIATPLADDHLQIAELIVQFLDEGEEEQAPSLPEGMTVILFVDIADSTALTTKLGDAAYREQERELDTALRGAITEVGGTPVEGKLLGDGVMAVFTSARQAIDAAQQCRDLGNEAGLPLHLGIHAGDVVREGNNVHGGAVQMASRVQGVAAPGEVLVSATVRDLARTSAGVAFEDRGEHELKGIPESQRLFAVQESAGGG